MLVSVVAWINLKRLLKIFEQITLIATVVNN